MLAFKYLEINKPPHYQNLCPTQQWNQGKQELVRIVTRTASKYLAFIGSQTVKDVFVALTTVTGTTTSVTGDSVITFESLQEASRRYEVNCVAILWKWLWLGTWGMRWGSLFQACRCDWDSESLHNFDLNRFVPIRRPEGRVRRRGGWSRVGGAKRLSWLSLSEFKVLEWLKYHQVS